MRRAFGLFAVLAALFAFVVAVNSLPLTVDSVPKARDSAVAVILVHYLAVGFCLLALTFGALIIATDGWTCVFGFLSSAVMAAALSSPPVASPLIMAVGSLVWLYARSGTWRSANRATPPSNAANRGLAAFGFGAATDRRASRPDYRAIPHSVPVHRPARLYPSFDQPALDPAR